MPMYMPENKPLFLTESPDAKDAYRATIEKTVQAIVDSFADGRAFCGDSPGHLKQLVRKRLLLPDHGIGFDSAMQAVQETVLPNLLHTSSTDYMAHLHSPAMLESIAMELVISTFNQSMDSWDQSPVATEIELETIRHLCRLYRLGDRADGTFTSGGSQSNLCGMTLARDWYCNTRLSHDTKKLGLPPQYAKLRLYTSELSHFSMEKSAHLLGLGYDAVVKVPVDDRCRMDPCALSDLIARDRSRGLLPFAVVATIGTTDYGSIDPLERIRGICDTEGLWLHADAAYASGVMLSDTYAHRIGPIGRCDSVTVDFHKMFLLPISCGAFLVREQKNLEVFSLHADYLNREEDEEDGYTNLVGKSMQTTRRFDALKVWFSFQSLGRDGYGSIIDTCIENAAYLYGRLVENRAFETAAEPEVSSVVFRLTGSCEKNKRVRRTLLHEHGVVIGQTVYKGKTYLKFTLLNPSVTHAQLDRLLSLIESSGTEGTD
jgi:L-2,4-diaminobutyrate decarboxylase